MPNLTGSRRQRPRCPSEEAQAVASLYISASLGVALHHQGRTELIKDYFAASRMHA